ncbi:Threonylcarbamoyl-AMP synthase [Astathelohania contejeani]|uniref:Threonylcarbamoyl-AMP synthase n=1 Tax=Astathelohania contejeani TaxID=164912 RepID=A0ABQ7HYE3_9MICR|nr:Threonylcarbamoyl-AMP synthase [Thelohania contejeani]
MNTQIKKINDISKYELKRYFKHPVVIPTETVYGLAADIYNEEALKEIFRIKRRPCDNPLIVHVASIEMLMSVIDGEIPEIYKKLIDRFWPGPLTMIFKARKSISPIITAGLSTVAVRMPSNKIALEIIKNLGVPLAAPSANISGRPSTTTVNHVQEDFDGKVELIIDGGECLFGLESTVINCLEDKNLLLRPGSITVEDLEPYVSLEVQTRVLKDGVAGSPGMKYKHYSPTHPLILFKGKEADFEDYILNELEKRKGVFGCIVAADYFWNKLKEVMINSGNPIDSTKRVILLDFPTEKEKFAFSLFSAIRELDKYCKYIFVLSVDDERVGMAISDRLEKAADEIIYKMEDNQ